MPYDSIKFSVFTKPWKMPLPELGRFVHDLGFDGVELPVRPGYQVEPERVADLAQAVNVLADFGVGVFSIAGPTDEPTLEACAEAGVPIIRICVGVGEPGYLAMEDEMHRLFDSLLPALDRCGVALGIQNHCDRCVTSAIGLRHLIEDYDPRQVCAVWDAAHCALEGEEPFLAVDILWSHLGMVNLKNAVRRLTTGPEAEVAQWEVYWTSGRQGLASWPTVAEELHKRDWRGPLCLTAEYSDEHAADRLIAEDLAFAQPLFAWGVGKEAAHV